MCRRPGVTPGLCDPSRLCAYVPLRGLAQCRWETPTCFNRLPFRPLACGPHTLSAILMKRLQPSQEASCSRAAMLSQASRTRVLAPTSSIWAEGQPVTTSGLGSALDKPLNPAG